MANFLTKTILGVQQLVSAISSSAGAGDAGKILETDSNGLIDPSFLPAGLGDQTGTANAATGGVTAGDFIYINGSGEVAPADNTSVSTAAIGYVLASATAGNPVTYYRWGVNTSAVIAANTEAFLGTAGGFVTTPPAFAVGTICQSLGKSDVANSLTFEYNAPIEYNNQ